MNTEKFSAIAEAVGLDKDSDTTWRIAQDIIHTLSLFDGDDDEARERKITAALSMLRDLNPDDPVEAQMIGQLICAYNIATESARHALNPLQPPQGRVIGLRLSAQFMTVFREHMRALTQYRNSPEKIRERDEKAVPRFIEIQFVSPKDNKRYRLPRQGEIGPQEVDPPDMPSLASEAPPGP